MSDQQNQTLDYFRSNVADWQSKATSSSYSVIEDRHSAVKHAIDRHGDVQDFLDVGCGTGQLCVEVSQSGVRSFGIDFAPEMIEKCIQNAKDADVIVEFRCASAFEPVFEPASFDVVSAQGFIEYITPDQLDDFLATAHQILRSGGTLAIGSRNRLFNIHSLNEYTSMEAELGSIGMLTEEAVLIGKSTSQDQAILQLLHLQHIYGHPVSHPATGIRVDTRYQYAPSEMTKKLTALGFHVERLYPINFHAFPSALLTVDTYKQLHLLMASFVSDSQFEAHQLLPFSSSFVISATKI